MSRDPAVGAHQASGNLALGQQDAGLELGAALERDDAKIEVNGLSLQKAPYLVGKRRDGVG
jgi:hypothetical protein